MTKAEKIAFDYGKSFNIANGKVAPCYDKRMDKLVSETRTESDSNRNMRNMKAWWNGVICSNPQICFPSWLKEGFLCQN